MDTTTKPTRIAILDFREDACAPGEGRRIAEAISAGLKTQYFRIVPRSEWLTAAGEAELSQQRRFHPGWAAQAMTLTGADAAVIGCLNRTASCQNLRVIMMDAGGTVLASCASISLQEALRLLNARRPVVRACKRERPLGARIQAVYDSSLLIDTDHTNVFEVADKLRIDLLLERAPDPYSRDGFRVLGSLTAVAGPAEVLAAERRLMMLHYSGQVALCAGNEVELIKF